MNLLASLFIIAILATVDTTSFYRRRRSLDHNRGPSSHWGDASSSKGYRSDRDERHGDHYSRFRDRDFSAKGVMDPIRTGTSNHNSVMDPVRSGISTHKPSKTIREVHDSVFKLAKKSSAELFPKDAIPSDLVQKKELKLNLQLASQHVDIIQDVQGDEETMPDLKPIQSKEDNKELELERPDIDIDLDNNDNHGNHDNNDNHDNRHHKQAEQDLGPNHSDAYNRERIIERIESFHQPIHHAHIIHVENISASLSRDTEANKPSSDNILRIKTEVKCPPVIYPNGRPKVRSNGKVVFLRCRSNFTRVGAQFAVCMNIGQWSHPFPVCVEKSPDTGCALGVLHEKCSIDACNGLWCPEVAGAVCRINKCGGCSPSWFKGTEEVTSRCNAANAKGG